MSYHVTILRTANGASLSIPLAEAIAAAQAITGWRFVERDTSFLKERGEEILVLWYQDGELWTKNPESWALEAMLELAKPLGARVRGDELETYETAERSYLHPDDVSIKQESERKSKAMLTRSIREQRLIRFGIIGFFVALGAVAFFVGKQFEKK